METFFLVAIVILLLLVVFQVAKATEYVSILKGEEQAKKHSNKINGFFMICFLVLGLFGVWYCNKLFYPGNLFSWGAASKEGVAIDKMIWTTLAITGFVFFVTQIMLFTFTFKFQHSDKRTASYYPHNNTLEYIWTGVPVVTFLTLAVIGLTHWFQINGPMPKDAQLVEITGHQFAWEIRYPGPDGVLGKRDYKLVNAAKSNPVGVDWNDKASRDDVQASQTMYVVVNKPVRLVINSLDVVHDVGLPAFRLKMDAVPGMPTSLNFTPIYTTDQMRKRTGDKDFEYEIACSQLCGIGHYGMRGIVKVVTQAEFDAFMRQQTPAFQKAQQAALSADNIQPGEQTLAANTTK